jgi:hypothetical protein
MLEWASSIDEKLPSALEDLQAMDHPTACLSLCMFLSFALWLANNPWSVQEVLLAPQVEDSILKESFNS